MAAFTPYKFQISTMTTCCCVLSLSLLISSCTGFPTMYKMHPQAGDSHTYTYYPAAAAQYAPETEDDYQNNNYNQWNLAQDPASMYELPEDYYSAPAVAETDPETQWAEIETLSNLLDMYDALNTADQQQEEEPTWGHIVNEEPAAELELEELKHRKKPDVAHVQKPKIPQPVLKFADVTSPTTPATPITPKNGQKEIPLLRPPAAKAPAVNQRSDKVSAPAQKASPYDTLRKYLTLEDALKKEAEKRRHEVQATRQKKSSGFVADAESLTSQLNNLKKSVT